MRVCPTCNSVFTDDTLKFCLNDGAPLRDGASEPTVVIPDSVQARTTTPDVVVRKKNTALWVVAGLLVFLIGGAGVAALMYFSYRLGSQSTANNKAVVVNINSAQKPTPAKTATPATPRPSATPEAPSEEAPDASPSDDGDDNGPVPISWTTGAVSFEQVPGKTYTFVCPDNGVAGTVWGSDVYTTDSSICTAAVHAGKIGFENGGEVTIEFRPGRSIYGSTTRNGVTSTNFASYPHSFVFK